MPNAQSSISRATIDQAIRVASVQYTTFEQMRTAWVWVDTARVWGRFCGKIGHISYSRLRKLAMCEHRDSLACTLRNLKENAHVLIAPR
jgi:hypothetical protein